MINVPVPVREKSLDFFCYVSRKMLVERLLVGFQLSLIILLIRPHFITLLLALSVKTRSLGPREQT